MPRKQCFEVGWGEKAFVEKLHHLFWENGTFLLSSKIKKKHNRKGGFDGHRKKQQFTSSLERGFLEWVSKRALRSVINTSCVLLNHYFESVFSKTQLLLRIRLTVIIQGPFWGGISHFKPLLGHFKPLLGRFRPP